MFKGGRRTAFWVGNVPVAKGGCFVSKHKKTSDRMSLPPLPIRSSTPLSALLIGGVDLAFPSFMHKSFFLSQMDYTYGRGWFFTVAHASIQTS